MISKEKIQRINELAAKSKTEKGLTPAEIKERDQLRKEYLAGMRTNLKSQLDRIRFVDEEPKK